MSSPAAADTIASPHARVRPVPPGASRWQGGFWAERFDACRRGTLPALWAIMEGMDRSQYLENFRVAAGMTTGRHRGASFNDGDFYKLLEASCLSLAAVPDPDMERRVEDAVRVIARAQRADGYLHTSVLIRQRAGDGNARPLRDPLQFELYNMGHLFTAACAHHRVTGRDALLAVARRTADFLETAFRRPTPELARLSVCPSHYMGTVEIYRVTGERRYLDLARRFLDLREVVPEGAGDDNQDRVPFRQQTEAVGHAVRANYLYAGAADLYAETGDRGLWHPLERVWESVFARKVYVTGGCGALYDGASPDGAKEQKTITRVHQSYGRNYQLPNDTAHNETCAAIGSVLWNWRMFLVTGEARFTDAVERTLYNAVLCGVSLEGADFFYTNPLRRTDPPPVELRWPSERVPYVSSFCCPPNIARTVAGASSLAYAVADGDLWVNLYGDSALNAALPHGRRVTLTQETDYPWDGRVRVRFDECEGDAAPFSLKLRIPAWAEDGAMASVNGERVRDRLNPGTYLELRRPWKRGDRVELDLPMPTRLLEAHPLVEEARGHAAVQRGPLVYCLESADLPRGVRLSNVLLPVDVHLKPHYDPRLLGGVVALRGRAALRRATADGSGTSRDAALYRPLRYVPAEPVDIRLIPYFAWGNRGPTEMSVWLPLRWT